MPIDLEMPAPLPDNAKITILRSAESMMTDGADAKEIVVAAVLDYFAEQKAFDVSALLSNAAGMALMLYGANPPNVIAALREVAPEITAGMTDEVLNDTIVWDGDAPDWLATATVLIRASLKAPSVLPMQRGKFLSKYGIFKADIEAIVPAASTPRTEAEFSDAAVLGYVVEGLPAEQAAAVLDLNAMLGIAPAAAPLPPTMIVNPMPDPLPVEISAADIRTAFMLYGEATAETDQETATKLGVSRQTLYNMRTGKTQKPKCDDKQSRMMIADIDVRIGKLMQAAELFRKVKS